MRFVWKISELKGDDKAIFQAKYHLVLIEDDLRIETEGYWDFDPKKATIPTSQVTEEMVANWIDEIVPYPQRLLNLRVQDKHAWESSASVSTVIADAEKALAGNGRILVRASGTEPTVRVMVEARSQELVDHWVEHVADAIRTAGSPSS